MEMVNMGYTDMTMVNIPFTMYFEETRQHQTAKYI